MTIPYVFEFTSTKRFDDDNLIYLLEVMRTAGGASPLSAKSSPLSAKVFEREGAPQMQLQTVMHRCSQHCKSATRGTKLVMYGMLWVSQQIRSF